MPTATSASADSTEFGAAVAGGGAPPADSSADDQLNGFLSLMALEDKAMSMALEAERKRNDAQLSAIERVDNFFIDEAHVREANIAEASQLVEEQGKEKGFLINRQKLEAADLNEEDEDKRILDKLLLDFRALTLKVRVLEEASVKVKAAKRRAQEKRNEFSMRVKYLEARQDRERRELGESQIRFIKNLNMFRHLLLTEMGGELAQLISEGARAEHGATDVDTAAVAFKTDADRLHETKMLAIKVKQQKETEQMREEHLLRVKLLNKLSEIELDQTEEWETLLADQKVQELEMEAEHVKEIETEQLRIQQQVNTLKAYNVQRLQQLKANELAHQQKGEAKQMIRQHKLASKYRKKAFFDREQTAKADADTEADAMVNAGIAAEQAGRNKLAGAHGGPSGAGAARSNDADESGAGDAASEHSGGGGSSAGDTHSEGSLSKQTSEAFSKQTSEAYSSSSDGSESSTAAADLMLASQKAEEDEMQRGRGQIEQLMLRQRELAQSLRQQHREQCESIKIDHRHAMSDFHAEQETEYQGLKQQQAIEMEQLMQMQKSADDMEQDNKVSNEIIANLLPGFVSEALKLGKEVPPVDLDQISVLVTDIVQFTPLTSMSSSRQIVELLNRMFSGFDAILDNYKDVYKLETVGDSYVICAGLTAATSGQPVDPTSSRHHAQEIAECALRFIKVVEGLDMTDQVLPAVKIRIGLHCGSAVGGVAGSIMPKFALFGEAQGVAALMEQKSQANRIHVSSTMAEFLKSNYALDRRADVVTLEGERTMQTYWLTGKKAANGAGKAGAAATATTAGRRSRGASAAASAAGSPRKTVRMAT
ncbi:Guanylate cyclase 2G [Allomyces javanicus]|nr:Guanylate cyclase 2G [Allomyces javanicus]